MKYGLNTKKSGISFTGTIRGIFGLVLCSRFLVRLRQRDFLLGEVSFQEVVLIQKNIYARCFEVITRASKVGMLRKLASRTCSMDNKQPIGDRWPLQRCVVLQHECNHGLLLQFWRPTPSARGTSPNEQIAYVFQCFGHSLGLLWRNACFKRGFIRNH